jgi:hypothetical protein
METTAEMELEYWRALRKSRVSFCVFSASSVVMEAGLAAGVHGCDARVR